MVGFYLAFSLLPLLGFNDSEVIKLMSFQELKPTSLEASLTVADIPSVSSSVLEAESWLKSNVLLHSATTKISKIVVGRGVLCSEKSQPMWSSVLPCLRNLHSAVSKWETLREVELVVALSSDCLDQHQLPYKFRGDVAKEILNPLLSFIQDHNLTYSMEQPSQNRAIEMRGEGKPTSRKLSSHYSQKSPFV